MITLYGWGPMFDCPSPSSYVMKTDMQLQMLGAQFNRAIADLPSVPKRKAPYLMDGGVLVEDSNFIRTHMEAKLGCSLFDGLDDAQRAASWAYERMAEGHLASVMLMERWLKEENFQRGPIQFFGGVPEPHRAGAIRQVLGGLASTLYESGIGRHSEAEWLQLAAWDLEAIAGQLAGQDYLFGDRPTAADASVSAVLIACATEFFDTPLTGLVRGHGNLVDYMDRMKARYFAKNLWPAYEMA